jgi:nitroreductase
MMTDLDTSTLSLLRRRRSVPPLALSGPGPDAAELDTMLTLAARVPDHGKLVPWRFIVFEGPARERAGELIADVFATLHPGADPQRLDLERRRLAHAPLVVAVVSRAAPHAKIPEWEQLLSAGAVAMALLVAVHATGYAGSWLTEWYSYDAAVREGLGLAEHERLAGFVHIGRPLSVIEDRVRPVMADIVTRF